MLGLGVGIVLLCAAVWFVLLPILKPHGIPDPVDQGVDPDDDLSPRAVALRALSEIEFDKATGKLSPADYDALKVRYTREAVEAMREPQAPPVPAETPVIPLVRRPSPKPQPTPTQACPVHGPRPEVGAVFCSECGRRVGAQNEDRFCTTCGTLLEPDSRFCGRCGSRVAA
ncbi:MAG TPA: zinc-ribbon domain-containing protein [Gemmatimonadales bacterium]|nr:zinc-ribbon domain-containing protein [Gemmatimonadales bacterium]